MKGRLLLCLLFSFVASAEYDRESFRQVVRKNMKDISGCYESGLKKNPNLEGRVVVEIEVIKDGTVRSVKADPSGSLTEAMVLNCIFNSVKSWKFPYIKKDAELVVVRYPFLFSRNNTVVIDKMD